MANEQGSTRRMGERMMADALQNSSFLVQELDEESAKRVEAEAEVEAAQAGMHQSEREKGQVEEAWAAYAEQLLAVRQPGAQVSHA